MADVLTAITIQQKNKKIQKKNNKTTKQNKKKNQNTVKALLFGSRFGKKWCLEKAIAKEIKIASRSSLPLCSSDSTPKLPACIFNFGEEYRLSTDILCTGERRIG